MEEITESDRHLLPLATVSYRAWQPSMGLLVRTSLGRPKWYPNQGRDLPSLWCVTPRGWYLHSEDSKFEHAYISQLASYGIDRISKELQDLADEHDADRLVLACFEGDRNACHRGLFAAWWRTQTGHDVPEATT